MKTTYPFRRPLILLLSGFLVRTIAALMKVLHWPYADPLLIAGTAVMAIAIIWLMVKLFKTKAA
ncbi:MAG: hypothetical protein ABW019_04540 [Chitinophagaceae bacterium]